VCRLPQALAFALAIASAGCLLPKRPPTVDVHVHVNVSVEDHNAPADPPAEPPEDPDED